MSTHGNFGKKLTQEHKKKLSESHKGKPRPWAIGIKMPYKGRITKGNPWSEQRRIAQAFVYRVPSLSLIKNGKEYSPFWKDIRKIVYKRDSWICQECGVHCHNKQQIQCHHIDYDTSNNDLSNLITLCASCHMKTNYRREDWINRYKNKEKANKIALPKYVL